MRAGEHILARVTASRRGRIVGTGSVTARFWGPGADPGGPPDHEAELAFSPRDRRWSAEVDTGGWAPGAWVMRARADDGTARGETPDPVRFILDA